MSAEELNRMFDRGLVDLNSRAAVQRLDPDFLNTFDLTEEERRILESPSPNQLAELGVHPMLSMWGAYMRNPGMAQQMSAGEYFVDYPTNAERGGN